MKKLIAITANTSWYLYNFRKNTIISLIENGYRVLVVSPFDDYTNKLKMLGCNCVNLFLEQSGTNPFKDVISFLNFLRVFIKEKPDVVLNFTPKNNIYSTLAANLCGIKSINNISGLGILFIRQNLTSIIAGFLYKVSQSKAEKIFFQNDQDRELFIKNKLAPVNLTDRLPGSGVDLKRFTFTSSDDDGVVRFLLVARMLFDKGIGHYIEAARVLKSKYGNRVEFRLLGFLDVNNPSAISKLQMQEWVDEGIIDYLGTSDCVEAEIAKVDCMVLPSYYREGVPKSLLEAAAMGKPLITTNNVGCRDTVDDGINGFLCEPRSTESLVEKLEYMTLCSHQQRMLMGVASRKKMEREFDECIVIQKYIEAIANCIT